MMMIQRSGIDESESLDELKTSRRNAHIHNAREIIASQLHHIEATPESSPLYPRRPYGLPIEMEGHRLHMWDLVFEKINDFETITTLRDVCMMFRELLKWKFIAFMLPQVVGNTFQKASIDWKNEREDWLRKMLHLRTLSKASKMSVDLIISGGLLGKDGTDWFTTKSPHYLIKEESLLLELQASEAGKRRLEKILIQLDSENNPEESFPFSGIIVDELHRTRPRPINMSNGETIFVWVFESDNVIRERRRVDVPYLRDSFESALEKIGSKITSFLYRTDAKAHRTYVNLVKWLAFMPNLQDLIVNLHESTSYSLWEDADEVMAVPTLLRFPTCPCLKRYAEGVKEFGVPFLKEIFHANRTIQEVCLHTKSFMDWEGIMEALDNLQLTKFHCLRQPDKLFFQHNFSWTLQLTSLAIWDTSYAFSYGEWPIPTDSLFNVISTFENLEKLTLSIPNVRDTGGCLKLPKLKHLSWAVFTRFKTLKFLEPLEALEYLKLDVSNCVSLERHESVIQFLEKWNVPSLFPALKRIRMKTQRDDPFSTIWHR